MLYIPSETRISSNMKINMRYSTSDIYKPLLQNLVVIIVPHVDSKEQVIHNLLALLNCKYSCAAKEVSYTQYLGITYCQVITFTM